WYPVHLDLNRDRDLLLHLLRRPPGPLRDDLHPNVGYVGVGLDREPLKGNDPPDEHRESRAENDEAVVESEIDKRPDHHCSALVWNSSALATTCCPGAIPDLISWRLPGSISPPRTSTRRNSLPVAGMYTQSRSCRWSTAAAGTAARVSFFFP